MTIPWIVVAIGVFFFVLQFVAATFARKNLRERSRLWVESCRNGERRTQSREGAISDLERGLGMEPTLGLLRRLGVVAPLLGVVLTTISFWTVDPALIKNVLNGGAPTEGSGARSIMGLVGPLFAGVCVGAVLAIVNQCLVWWVHREEDRCFHEAIDPKSASDFRDSNERLEVVIQNIERGGDALNYSSGLVNSMLTNARVAMEGMNESCNETATELVALASKLRDAIEVPVKEFVSAAAGMRAAAEDSSKEFRAASKALAKQTDLLEKEISESLRRQAVAAETQAQMAGSIALASKSIEESVASFRSGGIVAFEAQLVLATEGVRAMAKSIADAESRYMTSAGVIEDAAAKLGSSFREFATADLASVRKEVDELARSVGEVRRLADGVGAQSGAATAMVEQTGTALSTFVRTIRYDGEIASVALKSLQEAAQRVSESDQRLVEVANAVESSLRGLGGGLTEMDFSSAKASLQELSTSIRAFETECTAARRQLKDGTDKLTTLVIDAEKKLRPPQRASWWGTDT